MNSQVLTKIIPLFETGRGNNMVGTAGTFWAAYNGINEYLQYERAEDKQNAMNEMWFGTAAALNKRALDIGLTLVQAA